MSMKEKFADAVEILKARHGFEATVAEIQAATEQVRNLRNEFLIGSYSEDCAQESLIKNITAGRLG